MEWALDLQGAIGNSILTVQCLKSSRPQARPARGSVPSSQPPGLPPTPVGGSGSGSPGTSRKEVPEASFARGLGQSGISALRVGEAGVPERARQAGEGERREGWGGAEGGGRRAKLIKKRFASGNAACTDLGLGRLARGFPPWNPSSG